MPVGQPRTAPGPVRASDRAPDALLDGVRLFDLLRGPHWTPVAVSAEAPALPDRVRVVRARAQESYGRGLFLVEPDGYVGWGGAQAAGLTDCLGRFGTAQNASLGT
ncbi:hypothetical protein ACF05L_23485 [Streptomyces bobili]|uniref:aromatic-ring hydroxylase C-terminal domain-containing protein n=1 Tax=Streptomyces bobili TaxID=67280 RepID=UPI0036FAFFBB